MLTSNNESQYTSNEFITFLKNYSTSLLHKLIQIPQSCSNIWNRNYIRLLRTQISREFDSKPTTMSPVLVQSKGDKERQNNHGPSRTSRFGFMKTSVLERDRRNCEVNIYPQSKSVRGGGRGEGEGTQPTGPLLFLRSQFSHAGTQVYSPYTGPVSAPHFRLSAATDSLEMDRRCVTSSRISWDG